MQLRRDWMLLSVDKRLLPLPSSADGGWLHLPHPSESCKAASLPERHPRGAGKHNAAVNAITNLIVYLSKMLTIRFHKIIVKLLLLDLQEIS